MKKIYLLYQAACIIFFLQIYLPSSGQPVANTGQPVANISNGLNGENIVSTDYFDWGDFTATGSTLYADVRSQSPFSGKTYEYVWGPPKPNKIKDIAVKSYALRDEQGKIYSYYKSDQSLMVLLDNGDVYKLKLNQDARAIYGVTVDSVIYWGKVGSPGSETWGKITGDDIYVLSSSHLYTSKDSSTWNVDSSGLHGAHISDIALDTLQRVYVATDNGLFKQDTGVNTFAKVTAYSGDQYLYSVFADRKNRLLVGTNSGLYKSDNGTTWAIDTAGIGNQLVKLFGDDAYGNLYAVTSGALATEDHLYKSSGGNQQWQLIDSSIYNKTVNPIIINEFKGDSLLRLATHFGNFLSVDTGKTWVQKNNDINAENITGLAKTKTGKLLLSSALGIYGKPSGDSTWNKLYPQQGFKSGLPLYDDGGNDFYTIDNTIKTNYTIGVIEKSSDGGNTWLPDTTGLGNVGGNYFFVDENGAQHIGNSFYGSSYLSRLWVKPKNGSWALDTVGFPVKPLNSVLAMASDKNGYLYVGGYISNVIMRRPFSGGTWVTDTTGLGGASGFTKLKGSKGGIIAANNFGLYHRGNSGWSAVPLPPALSFPSIDAISIDSSGYIFAMFSAFSGSGVYYTGDLGLTWHLTGPDSADVTKLISYGDTTYALTSDQGAFVLDHQSAPPAITSFAPSTAGATQTVTIKGKHFTGATTVSFGGVTAASFTVVNDSVITAVVAAAGASGNVSVTNPFGTGIKAGFVFCTITTPTVSITSNFPSPICAKTKVTFSATAVNGGTPVYQWYKNNAVVGGNTKNYVDSLLNNNDSVWCIITSTATCVTTNTAKSNVMVYVVNPKLAPTLKVTINTPTTICVGTTVTFTATATNTGANPTYQWKKNNINVGTNSVSYIDAGLNNKDSVICVLTITAPCATPASITSFKFKFTVNPIVTPSVTMTTNFPSPICAKTKVTFTANPVNAVTPAYQWYQNGKPVGGNTKNYADSLINNGNSIWVIITSSPGCITKDTAKSNVMHYVVYPKLAPTLKVTANTTTTICAGTPVMFTAAATNTGTNPQYQWKKNNINVGTNSTTYTDNALNNGDSVICVLTITAPCATPTSITSARLKFTVASSAPLQPSAIKGLASVTAGQTNLSYAVTIVAGDKYNWTVPSGVTILSGQGTYKVIVNWGSATGIISVTAGNVCGASMPSQLTVTVPGSVAGYDPKDALLSGGYIRAYPNPVTSIATVEFSATTTNKYEVQVMNQLGQFVMSKSGLTIPGLNIVSLDMSRLASAIYYVRLIDKEHGIRIIRFMKAK